MALVSDLNATIAALGLEFAKPADAVGDLS